MKRIPNWPRLRTSVTPTYVKSRKSSSHHVRVPFHANRPKVRFLSVHYIFLFSFSLDIDSIFHYFHCLNICILFICISSFRDPSNYWTIETPCLMRSQLTSMHHYFNPRSLRLTCGVLFSQIVNLHELYYFRDWLKQIYRISAHTQVRVQLW